MLHYIILLLAQHTAGVSIFTTESINPSAKAWVDRIGKQDFDDDYALFKETDARRAMTLSKLILYNLPIPFLNHTTSDPKEFKIFEEYISPLVVYNHDGTTKRTTKGRWHGSRPRRSGIERVQVINNPEVIAEFQRKKISSSSSLQVEDLRSNLDVLGTTHGVVGGLKASTPRKRGLQDIRTHVIKNPEVLEKFMKKNSTSSSSSSEDLRRNYPRKLALRGLDQDVTSFRPHYESEDAEAAKSQQGKGEAQSAERSKASGFNNNRRGKRKRTSPPDYENEGVKSNKNLNIEWKEYLDSETKQQRKPSRGKNRNPENNWGKNQDGDNTNDWGNKPKIDYDKPADNWAKPNDDYDKPRNDWGKRDDYENAKKGRPNQKHGFNDPVKYRQQIDNDKAENERQKVKISWDKPKLDKKPERDWKDVGVNQDNWKKESNNKPSWDKTTRWKKVPYGPKFEERVRRPRDRGRPAGRQGDSYRIMTEIPWVGKKSIYAKSDK